MIFYTPVDVNQLFSQDLSPTIHQIEMNGIWIEGYTMDNQFIISKLISTNPNDYLKDTYQPGRNFSIYNE